MSIYTPYFYVIQEVSTGKFYAGSKWGKDANPKNFLTKGGYITSSNIIKTLIKKNGIDSFTIRKIRIFSSGENAYDYETRFLQKVKASKNPRFYNLHDNVKITPGTEEFEKIMMELYGVKNCMQSQELYSSWIDSFYKKTGVKNPYQLEYIKDKAITTRLERYGYKYFNKDITKQIVIDRYGVENISQLDEVKNKKKNTTRKNYGVDNPFQSEVIKEKIKSTNLEKYGAENVMQTEYGKDLIRKTMIEKYGVDNYSKTEEFKQHNKSRLKSHHSRPIIFQIKEYQMKYNLRFGRGWTNKSDEGLEIMMNDLIAKYGGLK